LWVCLGFVLVALRALSGCRVEGSGLRALGCCGFVGFFFFFFFVGCFIIRFLVRCFLLCTFGVLRSALHF